MNNFPIIFTNNSSIGLLDVRTMEFTRINKVNKGHPIYTKIKAPFNWYYQNNIMIIPDPIPNARPTWSKALFIDTQEIICHGSFVVFFHFEVYKDQLNVAKSLTLPEYGFLKKATS